MGTNIVYLDESGDDGYPKYSSPQFILTSICMDTEKWNKNYIEIKALRKELKNIYNFDTKLEMHTKDFLYDRNPYRKFEWSFEKRKEILRKFAILIGKLEISITNVIIDKEIIKNSSYQVLENALKYTIQRIENSSSGNRYIIISDEGRISSMRKTARKMQVYNPIKFDLAYINEPIKFIVEDILSKESKESYFIQIADFISYIVNLYYKSEIKNETLPKRVSNVIDKNFLKGVMLYWETQGILNTKASKKEYGLVIYP